MDKIRLVLDKISSYGIKTVECGIVAVVNAIEVVFNTVGDLLGVINDNISRVKNLFNRKS
jgi:hypothetical protein